MAEEKPARVTVSQRSAMFGGAVKRTRVDRAKDKANKQGQGIFDGYSALVEVAKPDGTWNWALLGPDPEKLPLSGGGSGGVEEMRDTLGKHAHSFGLLRMTFSGGLMKWLFVNAAAEDEGDFSAVQRGKAKATEPKMRAKVAELISVSAEASIKTKDQCTPEFFVSCLRPVVTGFDAEQVTLENYMAFIATQKEATKAKEEEKAKVEKIIEQVVAPVPQAAEPEAEEVVVTLAVPVLAEETRQRRRVKLYTVGDQVEIYSASQGAWVLDAEVVEVLKEGKTVGGISVRAGSMKVVYDKGKRFKWVAPQQMQELIRISPRPRPPESKFGKLQLETHSWFFTSNVDKYVELNKGWLQWWPSKEDASKGVKPEGSIYLLGLQVHAWDDQDTFKVRTDSSNGAINAFACYDDLEECKKWVELLWTHAAFCDEAREFYEAKEGGITMRSQLLTVMAQKNKQRHNLAESS